MNEVEKTLSWIEETSTDIRHFLKDPNYFELALSEALSLSRYANMLLEEMVDREIELFKEVRERG